MTGIIKVDDLKDAGGNSIVSSNGSGTFTYAAASGVNFTALNATQLTSGTIPAARIATASIANDLIDSAHYAAGSIDNEHIADDAIDSEHYADGSIDNAHIADDAIDSEHYADGSIDNAHIADDAIDSEHYAAGSIDTAHIADDQITLAKMASGTDGNVISYDASGNPVAIATGSDGQVLTSAGAGQPPAFEAAAAGGDLSFGGDTFGANKVIGANDAYSLSLETNGNTAITIDSSGRIQQVLQPMSYAYGSTDGNQTISNQTLTTLAMSVEGYDIGGNYNNSNYTFTCPIAGKYFVQLSIGFNAGTLNTNTRNFMGVYQNGNGYNQCFGSPTGSNDRFTMYHSNILHCAASTTLIPKVYVDNAGSAAVWYTSGTSRFTWFTVGYLG